MLRKIKAAVLPVLACIAFATAAPQQSLKIVPDPSAVGVRARGDVIRVEWVQLKEAGSQTPEREPLRGDVYYATSPAGGDLTKYTKLASTVENNTLAPFGTGYQKRVTRFVPGAQGGRMNSGAYYVIVASEDGAGNTLYSDYLNLMVADTVPPALISPKADVMKGELVKEVTESAPLFTWKAVPGVPYYHIILSDVPFVDSKGNFDTSGVNIIWQAITPNTRIAYGAPDPSNTITAPPPPLSPGATYSWMVLNNYGNHPAFTSWNVVSVMDGVAGRFSIKDDGRKLAAPRVLYPTPKESFDDEPQITFVWDRLDTNANSYLVNLFREGSAADFGMGDMGKFTMSLLAWETTVPRGGNRGELSVALDAAGTLTGGSYKWRVYALDSRGKAYTSESSASTFTYKKSNEGKIRVETFESVGGENLRVGYVELKLEVLSGPTMTPLLFYTGGDGALDRQFPAGTYRISTVKEGYPASSSTVTVRGGGLVDTLRLRMSRSDAVLYGRALSAVDSSALNTAKVTAVSEWGDTVSAATDGSGSFVLACRAADWTVTVEKPGFRASSPQKVTLGSGGNLNFGNVYLSRNAFVLSGVVKNSTGDPLIGAQVRILREGVVIDELASTPQNGMYAFYLNAGAYTVTAEKPGFAMFSRAVVVTGTGAQDITLREGAVLVGGAITGRSWVASARNGLGDYVFAPIPSARVTFAEIAGASAKADTFVVASDAVFGKFSVSLPPGKEYSVTASAPGFAAGSVKRFSADTASGLSKAYADTLFAFAVIKGRVTGLSDGVQADVLVYGADGQIVASAKSVGGAYEVRNIPDGNVTVGAGAVGFYTNNRVPIAISGGKLDPNRESYDFAMAAGNKTISFTVDGYNGSGSVKFVSPLNATIPFSNGAAAPLSRMGSGDYVIEAGADSSRLELSYRKFTVPLGGSADYPVTLSFPFTYTPEKEINLGDDGRIKISWPKTAGNPSRKTAITLYYMSEGSVRFDSIQIRNIGADEVPFSFAPVRDGCDLYYYFRVQLENGDIYGSGKQLYRTKVNPNARVISRVAVEPGAAGGDTLVLPSSYRTEFVFRAFYGDQFVPISGDAGAVSWSVADSKGAGMAYSYLTPGDGQDLVLRASFTPSSGYKMKGGEPSVVVEVPIRVTGKPLKSISILRNGDVGPILNTEKAGFSVQGVDGDGKPVTVSPKWSVYPTGAGKVGDADGLFTPSYNFVGMAEIAASAGGLTLDYKEPGATALGQRVNYALRYNAAAGGDTANTMKGMRVVFGPGAVREGASANIEVTVPQLTNLVQVGTENYRMADSIAFDLSFSDLRAIAGDVVLLFNIPEQLRSAGGHEFRVARWYPDSLKWIPVDEGVARIEGGVISAVLSPAALSKSSKPPKSGKAAAVRASAGALFASARYALVTKTDETSLSFSISPHPFSPYIVPVKEYGREAKAGTCIKVNVQAPGTSVASVKVRIHNATGKMVWGVEKLNAQTGENRFWWNGRTSGRGSGRTSVSEEVWSPDYYDSNADRPLCRNGRYYVVVILTDTEGKQLRSMKPLVLMK